MRILIIDLGSYAVKFLEAIVEKKHVNVLEQHIVILDKVRPQLKDVEGLEELHFAIIQSYLEANPFDGKIYFQLPDTLTTSRFLTLPIGQKRKAEMMIPFQLEENLPFPVSQIHTTSSLWKVSNKETKAVINITELEAFDAYYEVLKSRDIVPAVLTSELAWVHSFADAHDIEGPIAIIDFGHKSTKCYFIYNKQVISNHISHIGGEAIDQMIAHTYEIEHDDAVIYKHENCFLLTEQQYKGVEKEQARFASLMKKTLQPLILSLKRWEVGFRVKTGHPIEKFYLTGGSANINNAENFFTQALNLPVEIFNPYKKLEIATTPLPKEDQLNFSLASMALKASQSKIEVANFLYGQYASDYNQNIPSHSTAFLLTRVMIICLIISTFLLGEKFLLLNEKERRLDVTVSQDNLLERGDINLFRRAPDRLVTQLKQRVQQVEQEVNMISAAASLNALSPLVQLSNILSSNQNVSLTYFRSQDKSVEGRFSSDDLSELKTLRDFLASSSLNELRTTLNEENKELEISFKGEAR